MQNYRTAINCQDFPTTLMGWLFIGGLLLSFTAYGETMEEKLQVQIDQENQEKVDAAKRKANEKAAAKIEPEMLQIPSGSFTIGKLSDKEREWLEKDYNKYKNNFIDEKEQKHIKIVSFYLAKYEVTVRQFNQFVNEVNPQLDVGKCHKWDKNHNPKVDSHLMWSAPGFPQTEDHPVVCVSWNDAKMYADWLSNKTGKNYRLPKEEEWEFAARAGNDARYSWGDEDEKTHDYANACDSPSSPVAKEVGCGSSKFKLSDNYPHTAPVGQFDKNSYGLYDMYGNVAEWTDGSMVSLLTNSTGDNDKPPFRGGILGA